jgi:coenzyme F420-0:L-glutamate ligase/coenzyme F420-1:gamma-L-glutamate ligase
MITILPVKGIPDVKKGDELAGLIVASLRDHGEEVKENDVIVIAQKIVSKAEGRLVTLAKVKPSAFAVGMAKEMGKDPRHVEVILRESKRIIRMRGGHLITETPHGFICANAAVDASNVGRQRDMVTILPVNPDASAYKIRRQIRRLTGRDAAVIITDTFGRPWRVGHVNFAIGISGLKPIRDYRGTRDIYRRRLRVTEMAVADELASAGELVMNKADRVPVALIRGYKYPAGRGSVKELLRPEELDLFR